MNGEFRSGQGTIIPRLFIGLGGVGSRIVDRIAGRAAYLPNWESQLRPLTNFVSIDTNEFDQHELTNVPIGNRLNIAGFDKAKAIKYMRRSKDPQALQWLDRGYQPRAGIKPGAGQIRVESRLGFFYNSLEIRKRLKELIHETLRPGITWRQSSSQKYNVYVFCTLAGGTGSGSFLSVAYLIDALLSEQGWQPRIVGNLLLSTLMLEHVGPELHPDIHANTYAALKELEHLTKLDYKQVNDEGRASDEFVYCRDENNRAVQRVKTRPFFLSFVFDRPAHLGLPNPEEAIADAAFLQIFTPIIDKLAGELDNYEKNTADLTHFPGDLRNVGLGYTKNFGAFGAAALVLPGHDFLEYAVARFAAQATRSQITFGVDPSNASDDRARSLARLAVDYSDPKFLNMSDEGRERAINQSFLASVQEMARQDERQELLEGYWYRLVESVDQGRKTGVDDKGEEVRGESLIRWVERKLEEVRRDLLNRISIKKRAYVFHREGVNQYSELVGRLIEDIRGARKIVDEGVRGLEAAALEGEIVSELRLDPIAERYLVIRLLDRCEGQWIPEAQQQLEKARARDISNPKVREHLEREIFESLKDAASKRTLFNRDQAFLSVRDEAQGEGDKVIAAAYSTFDAEIRLRQLRSLLEYLRHRSRQYARLATRMDALVQDLERDAERLRRGEVAVVAPLALRVEVFETLDEPRRRIWDRVYLSLFIEGGRYMGTFDRQALAETISRELKPVVRGDGTIAEKGLDQTVNDLRRALRELGSQRLRPAILGGDGQPGLDLIRGLELEARLMLQPGKPPGQEVTEHEIDEYRKGKFHALAQVAGVLARVSSTETKALDDGVITNRTRQLIVGIGAKSAGTASQRFVADLKAVLAISGRQVKEAEWQDPRIAIVHDVEMPIPLYYIEPVTGEIENAYQILASDERRAYNLHTDFNWERSLPNLNPRGSEITVGWSLRVLTEGLLTQIIERQDGHWVWNMGDNGEVEQLGKNLSSTLYRLGEIHRIDDLQKKLEFQLQEAEARLDSTQEEQRRMKLQEFTESLLSAMGRRELRGEMAREDSLDRPILRALQEELKHVGAGKPSTASPDERLYEGLRLS